MRHKKSPFSMQGRGQRPEEGKKKKKITHSIPFPSQAAPAVRSQTKPPAAFGELKRRERAELGGGPPDGFSHSTLMPRFALHTVVQREVGE